MTTSPVEPLSYIACDVPPGMTLAEYRRRRAARPSRRGGALRRLRRALL